jgi:hypothetical protein
MTVAITVAVLVVAGAAAVLWIQYGNPTAELTSTPITHTPTPAPAADATANWKTYTNTQYGFEFKYPAYLHESKDVAAVEEANECFVGDNNESPTLCTQVLAGKLNKNEIFHLGKKIPSQDIKEKIVAGKTVYYFTPESSGVECYFGPEYRILLNEMQNLSLYSWNCIGLVPNIEKDLDQILSTFKYTNTTSATPALKVTSISTNSKVSFPLTVTGTIDNSNTQTPWTMFEGQAGTAQLYYNYQNSGWKVIGSSAPIKVKDWTAKSTTFTTTLNFNNEGIGLASGTPMKVTFTEEDPSGQGQTETVELPIVLK